MVQKDRKIDILRKHIAMKRELAQREEERQRREAETKERGEGNYNGTCRYLQSNYLALTQHNHSSHSHKLDPRDLRWA